MSAKALTDINFVALVAQSYSVMGMKFSKILIIIALLSGVCLGAIWYANKSSLEGHGTVTYYGGAEGVSGSLAILKTRDGEFMIDCGSFYPEGEGDSDELKLLAAKANQKIPRAAINSKALLLTHAHADHIGRIPLLVRSGFEGEIHGTDPTKQLSEVMLEMGIRWESSNIRNWIWSERRSDRGFMVIHWNECEWQKLISHRNRVKFIGTIDQVKGLVSQRLGKGISPCKPCAAIELEKIMARFRTTEIGDRLVLTDNVTAEFFNSSHIPGAVSILMTINHDGESKRVLFSGDVGNDASALIGPPTPPPGADLIFMEATYGASSEIPNPAKQRAEFRQQILKSIEANNIIWIPAFALDRTQKILHELYLLNSERPGLLNNVPVYVPSPSANAFTKIYVKNVNNGWFREEITASSFTEVKQQSRLDENIPLAGPAILITTSGMMDNVLSNELIPDLGRRNDVDIFFVGYQSPVSEGAHVRDFKQVEIHGQTITINASIYSTTAFSGHGRAQDMDLWLTNQSRETPIYLVHGEMDALRERKNDLLSKGWTSVHIARIGVPIGF
jgi:metallo-beta-lactamase family protein